MEMRLRSMHDYTGRLPLVEVNELSNWIGKNTSDAILNGAAVGMQMEIEGYMRYASEEYSDVITVMTGGNAPYFAEPFKTEIFVRPNLVLSGLNEILKVNAG